MSKRVVKSKNDLVANLQSEGLAFTDLVLVSEGEFETFDADWNYKDIPHLHYLHQLVEAYPSFISDELIATINMQKILGIKFPVAVFNYHSGHNTQNYYVTMFFFAMLIETRWESIGPLKTRVTTTYSIGSRPIFKIFHPLIKWLVTKNYDNLMSEDIPMRTRRGQLRKWGYSFKSDMNPHSFIDTMKVNDINVVPPKSGHSLKKESINVLSALPADGEILIGESNHHGLKIVREGQDLMIFPRLCMHEGACLDRQKLVGSHVKCPWHGKSISPLAKFSVSQKSSHSNSIGHKFNYSDGILEIDFNSVENQKV